ncbi:MAG: hypothetical protein M3507_00155 [Actinomycetota bacterium]|jgi:hypothetical protein|nr:hypothetical protein [Actinomycetota bacterium]
MSWLRSALVVVGGVFAILMVAVVLRVVSVVVEDGDDDGRGERAVDEPTIEQETTAPPDLRELVQVSGTVDSFTRPNDPATLSSVPGGPPWSAEAGTWGIGEGQAYLSGPVPDANLVVVDLGQGDGAVSVRLGSVVSGAGLVFRYRSPLDHWAVVAVPGYATWAVVKVVDGTEEVVGNTGLSSVVDGTTVAVRLRGPTIEIAIDERLAQTITDETLADATRAGLRVTSRSGVDAAAARFDDFVIAPAAALPSLDVPATTQPAENE